eukprot:Plantae.Rhodophyta-Hildenbrandia_rubra.ctg5475.p1 GENE.Plantae.Rhodophyta-Hildenbrandia_rubra.ctg5475~~Plantae.Rhodophyta-Hildenbrandia_rubra.ctg5475.p1  ORF type:complete len:371 (-),score=70.94 Plantae.Rhodophyta-Hildenbrandia_rubra.ctg5475:836-1948(-)
MGTSGKAGDLESGVSCESTPLIQNGTSNGVRPSGLRPGTYNPVGSHHRRYSHIAQIGKQKAEQAGDGHHSKNVAKCFTEVLQEMEEQEQSNWRLFAFSLFGSISHVVGGAFTLSMLEGWAFVDALFFCVVSTTTVGYGNVTPKTTGGKLFVIYYVLYALALVIGLLTYVVGLFIDRQEELMLAVLSGSETQSSNEGDDRPGIIRWIPKEFYQPMSSLLFLLMTSGVGVYAWYKIEGLSAVNAFYTTVVSATTVGYGDFVPTSAKMKWFTTFWLIFSTIGMGKLITDVTDALINRKQNNVNKRLLSAQVDARAFEQMDGDKSGTIDKAEYLGTMLVKSGKVDKEYVDQVLQNFNNLDTDHNGTIDRKESFK